MRNLCERCARQGRNCPIEPKNPVARCVEYHPDPERIEAAIQRDWRARQAVPPIRS